MPQLNMPLYVSPDDVIQRMQLEPTLDGVESAVTSGIIGAQLHVQAVLRGELGVKQRDETFFCDSDSFSGIQPGGVFRLEIRSGFIRRDQPVLVTSSGSWNMTDVSSVATNLVKIDYERGYIHVDGPTCADKYVRVQCTTGFYAEVPTPALPTVAVPSYSTVPAPYDSTLQYVPGDTALTLDPLTGNVLTWLAVFANKGVTPPNNMYWTQVVQVPVTPTAWDDTVQYAVGNVVTFTPMGGVSTTFICKAVPPVGGLPTVTTYWTQVVYNTEQIPNELYEAIIDDVPAFMNSSQQTNRANEAKDQYATLTSRAQLMLTPWMRLQGFTFRSVG